MRVLTTKQIVNNRLVVGMMALLLVVTGPFIYMQVRAGHALLRSIQITNSMPLASAQYIVSFTTASAGIMGSVQIQICSNDPFPGQPCTVPNGLDMLGATFSAQTGETGFSVDPSSTANNIILSRLPTASASSVPVSFTFDNVINPANPATYYVRLQTFASTDGTGAATDDGGLAYAVRDNNLAVSAEVPPFLLFCSGITINDIYCNSVTGNYVDFGSLHPTSASSATTQLLVTTNGASGYTTQLSGNTMISGNNAITSLVTNDVSRPGVNQFGLNLRANTTPAVGSDPSGPGTGQPSPAYNIPNQYRFNSGEIIASNALPEDTRLYTVSYLLNISASQPIGIYSTTISYITLANF